MLIPVDYFGLNNYYLSISKKVNLSCCEITVVRYMYKESDSRKTCVLFSA